jgi:hypothetical protein
MLSCLTRKPLYFNKNLNDYCKRISDDSIRKLTFKCNLERINPKIKIPFENEKDKSICIFYHFLVFLSISTMTFYLYKRIK